MSPLRLLVLGVVIVQAGLSAWYLGKLTLRDNRVGRWELLTAGNPRRIDARLGEGAAVYHLIEESVPDSAWLFVDWPAPLRIDPATTTSAERYQPVIDWMQLVEQLRTLTYPTPTVSRAMPNAIPTAETMAASGTTVWVLGPGAEFLRQIKPLLPPKIADDPLSFGLPRGRKGWTMAAENGRCQLWRYQKD
ncbi:MAG: hypothetical protein NXI31_21780 [bacterium]|nr:hypothetical protein [bacterium]